MNEITLLDKFDFAVPSAFVVRRNNAVEQAKIFEEINDDNDFHVASSIIAEMQSIAKQIEALRKPITQKIDAFKKAVMARKDEYLGDIPAEIDRLKKLCGEYATRKEQERQQKIEAARQAEADAAIAEEIGAELPQTRIEVDDKLKSANVRQVVVYNFEIVDERKLDRKFLSPDLAKIRAFCDYLKKSGINPEDVDEAGLKIFKEIRIDGK